VVSKPSVNVPSDVLREIYESPDVNSAVLPQHAEALYRTVRKERPRVVVEIGMAFGASSVAILTALEENGGDGQLISIDPKQSDKWGGRGVAYVEQAELTHRHRLIEETDYLALPELVRAGVVVDFGYIDGWHTFDYTLLDFFYLDRMVPAGGIIALNDCDYPAVEKVAKFVLGHRRYEEIDVGLPERKFVRAPWHRLIGRWVNPNDRYFRKSEVWEPAWDFFAEF
jgi:predicted O-methyltransferase YrrM